jgi:uncharacterized protein
MSESKTYDHTGGYFLLGLAIVVAAWLLGGAIVDFKKAGDSIAVTGSAKRAIVSDLITWRGEVYSQQQTKQEAYAEVKRFTERFESFLKDNGVKSDEYSFGSLNTSEIEEYDSDYHPTGRIRAYRMTRSYRVESKRVDEIANLALRAGDLVSEGVSLNSWQPEYLYTKLADLRVEMLAEATKDAQLRAKAMVEATGAELGELRSAQMGVFQITQPYSTETSGYGMYDTSTKEKDITAVAKVNFAVE